MLVKTNSFNVVERGKMDAILNEVGLQQTGCTSTECAVEIGKILNVQQMITGTIGKIGETYTIDVVLIEVETSQIIKSFTYNYQGKLDGLLSFMASIANELAKTAQPMSEKFYEIGIGSLKVITEPASAEIILDDKFIGKSPLQINNISTGEHMVKLVASGYVSTKNKVFIQKGKVTEHQIKLEKMFTLKINSVPNGADVYINNSHVGKTPYFQMVVGESKLNILIRKESYEDWTQNVIVMTETEIVAKLGDPRTLLKSNLTLNAGGKIGLFSSSDEGFGDIYKDKFSYEGFLSLGYREYFIIGKYRIFNSSGESKLENITIEGVANWEQTFTFFGARFYPYILKGLVYIDLGVILSKAKEKIGTKNPEIPELSRTAETEGTGFALSGGLSFPISKFLNLNGEIEYSLIPSKGYGGIGGKKPDIGGLFYGVSLNFIFNKKSSE
jgi:opacity protein-like surface antigen